MKRILILLLAVVLVLTLLAGCKSSEPAPASSEAPASSSGGEASGGEKSSGSEPVPSQSSASVESSEAAESSETSEETEPVKRSGIIEFYSGKGIVQFNADIPEEYTLVLPYLDLSHEELQKRMLREQIGSIEVYRDEDIVFFVLFIGKDQFDQADERRKLLEENPSEEQTVETIKEETLENGDYCVYSKHWYEKSNDPRFPDDLTVYQYSRKFGQSQDCAMICYAVLPEEEATELFDCLAITFDHDDNEDSSESTPEINRTADYTQQFENVILNIAFISEEGYRVTIPSENPTPDSSEESSDPLDAPPTCCVYRGEEIALNFYFTGYTAWSMPGMPTPYEQRFARAELNGTLIDQGEKDVFDYFFYERPEPLDESIITYCYMGRFKEFPTYGFTAYSATREEAEKQFAGMTIWLTDAEG